jgi:hypothetical protein
MFGQTEQRIAMKQCTTRGLDSSPSEDSSSCIPWLAPQDDTSIVQSIECSMLHGLNKRSRDFCFIDVLDYKAPCMSYVMESVEILSDRFSQLGGGPQDDSEKFSRLLDDYGEQSDAESSIGTPRKRLCRGLVRTKKSAKLCLLGSLSDTGTLGPNDAW